jgi:hypothetical protein
MSDHTELSVSVYMDNRDITPWCQKITWSQPNGFLEKEWSVTTHAWALFDFSKRYNIYASYDPTKPQDTCVIREGYLLPDQRLSVNVQRDQQPLITLKGKSYSARSFRKTPRETIVCVPAAEGMPYQGQSWTLASIALDKYDGPKGRIRVLSNCWTLRQTCINLATRAEFNADYWGPNIPVQALIIPPTQSYWEAITKLIEPFAIDVYYSEWHNFLLFVDPVSREYRPGGVELPGNLIARIDAVPVIRKRPRRVLVKVPSWH